MHLVRIYAFYILTDGHNLFVYSFKSVFMITDLYSVSNYNNEDIQSFVEPI